MALVALVIGLGVVPKPLLGVTETDTAVLVPRSQHRRIARFGGTTVQASAP